MRYFLKIGVLIAAFLSIISCRTIKDSNNPNNSQNMDISSKLKGEWILKSIEESDVKDIFKGKVPTLTFNLTNNTITGNGGCNQFNGSFSLKGNVFTPSTIASTLMMCAEPNQEDNLLKLLGQPSTLIFKNYVLQFVQDGKVVLEYTPKAR